MTLRTPRRRISPRAKRRCRAIKDFLRRALGTSSQPDIKINSSIAINVTDLKHKINGLEHQLNEVNKHCQDLACLETSSPKDCPILVDTEDGTELASMKEQSEISSVKKSSAVETRLLYKTPESDYRKSSGRLSNVYDDPYSKCNVKLDKMVPEEYTKDDRLKKRKRRLDARLKAADGSQPRLCKHKTRSVYEKMVSNVSTSSYHSLIEPRTTHTCYNTDSVPHHEKKRNQRFYLEPKPMNTENRKTRRDLIKRNSPENVIKSYSRHKRKTNTSRDLDQDFIEDLIKRQYKPMKMFSKRESLLSQISAPVCRDREFSIREDIIEGSDLCSCCVDGRKKINHRYEKQLNDKRSICDTRLYSSKNQMRRKQHHRRDDVYNRHYDIYNDAEQYDLIPVKEKSSPKSRRKMFVDITPYSYYREVPPSPRTLRPKLNLKAQYYTEFEDYMMHRKNPKRKNYSPHRYRMFPNNFESNVPSDMFEYYKEKRESQTSKKNREEKQVQHDAATISGPLSPKQNNIANDNSFNKSHDSDLSENKTDKALSEIKNILQSFLQEIKKETVSQCGNSDIMTSKTGDKCLNEFRPSSTKLNTSVVPESGLCVNNFGIPQCNMPPPFIPPFANTCCYPILPICPMNCVKSGFILPSPSYTCNCVNNSKDGQPNQNESDTTKTGTETEQLIKEIYKVVAQNTNSVRKNKNETIDSPKGCKDEKILTCRSAGGSCRITKHDVEVATQKVKCHSKSCEAIGSRLTSDTYYSRTNPTYSDTILDRLSLEATASNMESESSREQISIKKDVKQNKFARVLRSFGLLKKKKDVIEELSESESTVEVSIEAKQPFRQEITNYSMYSEEYDNRPPIARQNDPYHPYMDYRHGYARTPTSCFHGCPRHVTSPHSPMYDGYNNHKIPYAQRTESPYGSPRPHPSAPPYPNPYDHHHHNQPQVPLCLKEIEVKSTGTQSERKMPFFRRLKKKMQEPVTVQRTDDCGPINCSTQTAEKPQPAKLLPTSKLAKINWKTLQAKVHELDNADNFTFKTQKNLAEGDIKMRNAMLRKLFHKRNPFSPRNLIVRTLLGKDKSSYGDPPMLYRPRMFV
ncbi:unnamed protein product [Diatraea saccharalis]|uniref:Uncharacterized protein n=1 Tax=Diatraea saccharalis TaxID=40085 RepID=A0A9N9QUB9_9NEOP|nr:unnamed protein product [Diatraea saccharalis]